MEEGASVSPAQGQQTPAGWYKDPTTGNDRYWDGQQWSQEAVVKKQDTLAILGWVFAIIIPVVGLILGIIVAARGKVQTGLLIVGLSIVAAVVWYSLTNM